MPRSQLPPRSALCACLPLLVLVASNGCQGPDITYGEHVRVRPRPDVAGTGASESGAGGDTGSAGDVSVAGTGGEGGSGVAAPGDAGTPGADPDAGAVDEPDAAVDAGEPPRELQGYCPATWPKLLEPSLEGDGSFSGCPEMVCDGVSVLDELEDATLLFPEPEPVSAAEYAGCTRVTGDVLINEEQATDLSVLHCLERVDGSFMIWQGGKLTSVDGLDALHYVGRDLRISRMPPFSPLDNAITQIDGLSNLRAIGGSLSIRLSKVSTLHGLRRLTAIGKSLELEEPRVLTDLSGLEDLQAIGKNLRIAVAQGGTPMSTSLVGLDLLETIGGSVEILGGVSYRSFGNVLPQVSCLGGGVYIPGPNENLETIDLMPSLRRIGGHVVLSGNPVLRTITLLANVEHVHGSIQISGNLLLQELAMYALQQVDGSFFIVDNPLLPDCPLIELAGSIGAHQAEIHDNMPAWFGCTPAP